MLSRTSDALNYTRAVCIPCMRQGKNRKRWIFTRRHHVCGGSRDALTFDFRAGELRRLLESGLIARTWKSGLRWVLDGVGDLRVD